jgi:hypothetical protein
MAGKFAFIFGELDEGLRMNISQGIEIVSWASFSQIYVWIMINQGQMLGD